MMTKSRKHPPRVSYDASHFAGDVLGEVQFHYRPDHVEFVLPVEYYRELSNALRNEIDSQGTNVRFGDRQIAFNMEGAPYCHDFLRRLKSYITSKERASIRRDELMEAGGHHKRTDLQAIFDIQEGRCYYSGDPISFEKGGYTLDHITPLTDGGTHWPRNIALCTKYMNDSKNDTDKESFLRYLGKYRGKDWLKERRQIIKAIDKARMKIHKERVAAVQDRLDRLDDRLKEHFNTDRIYLGLETTERGLDEAETPRLYVGRTRLDFPPGYVRDKRLYDLDYLIGIVQGIIAR